MSADAGEQPRRRGRPARISRERIVAAARALDPETLTMQAVAEQLGVDRKALNYHVSDRDGLLELVALDALHAGLGRLDLPVDADWRQTIWVYAYGLRDAMVSTGALFDYVRMPLAGGLSSMESTEQLVQALLSAGFDEEETGRAVAFLAEFLFCSARDAILVARYGVHPQIPEIQRMLADAPPDALPGIRRLAAHQPAFDAAQLAFDLEIFIAGLERRLTAKAC